MNGKCPPGYICINNINILSIILVVLGGLYFFNRENNRQLYDKIQDLKNNISNTKQELNDIQDNRDNNINQEYHEDVLVDRDRVALSDPLYPPLKRNFHIDRPIQYSRDLRQDPRGMPINIETRGPTEDFQQIGMLYKESISDTDSTPGNNSDSNILPIFGKPLYRGSSNWLYYTSSDKNTSIKIPISKDGKDCTDDQGCKEIYDGDQINIPAYNGSFKVKMYKFDKPRYIPYVY